LTLYNILSERKYGESILYCICSYYITQSSKSNLKISLNYKIKPVGPGCPAGPIGPICPAGPVRPDVVPELTSVAIMI
jgi:hypothetical protein